MTLNTRGFRLSCALAVAVLVTFSGIAFGGSQSSANYAIEADTLRCGGGDMGSTGYDLLFTLGQPSTAGASSTSHYKRYTGFWHPLGIAIRAKAMP